MLCLRKEPKYLTHSCQFLNGFFKETERLEDLFDEAKRQKKRGGGENLQRIFVKPFSAPTIATILCTFTLFVLLDPPPAENSSTRKKFCSKEGNGWNGRTWNLFAEYPAPKRHSWLQTRSTHKTFPIWVTKTAAAPKVYLANVHIFFIHTLQYRGSIQRKKNLMGEKKAW